MSKKISIKQFLMSSGKFDKVYDCINSIKQGNVTLNNQKITNPNHFFNPKKFIVKLNEEKLKSVKKIYLLFNKPAGYICQKSQNEKNIYDIIKKLDIDDKIKSTLFAVGRLDKETEGLLILTNDGKLVIHVTNPESHIAKRYFAILEKTADKSKIKILENGIGISINYEKYKTKPCKIKITGEKEAYISIEEGKKRQIRKMFEAIGNKIIYLRRVSIGGLQLGNLKVGDFKQLAKEEIYDKLNIQ